MTTIETIEVTNYDGQVSEHVLITHADGSFTSMPKSVYDEQQSALETPAVIDEASTE